MKPSTLLSFHRALVHRKYRLLFSPKRRAKPGPKGPDLDLIRAVVEMKQRNPRWGCPRIAEQIGLDAHLRDDDAANGGDEVNEGDNQITHSTW